MSVGDSFAGGRSWNYMRACWCEVLKRAAELLLKVVAVVMAEFKLCAVAHHHAVFAAKHGL